MKTKISPLDLAQEVEVLELPKNAYVHDKQTRFDNIDSFSVYTYTSKSTQTGLNRDNDSDTDQK